jgi:hypothetical protein
MKKIFHFPFVEAVDLIKQIDLWWGLAFSARKFTISIFRAWQ